MPLSALSEAIIFPIRPFSPAYQSVPFEATPRLQLASVVLRGLRSRTWRFPALLVAPSAVSPSYIPAMAHVSPRAGLSSSLCAGPLRRRNGFQWILPVPLHRSEPYTAHRLDATTPRGGHNPTLPTAPLRRDTSVRIAFPLPSSRDRDIFRCFVFIQSRKNDTTNCFVFIPIEK